MSVATQSLAPVNSSVADFLTEIGRIARECEKTRPSKLSLWALERWRQGKGRQIAEVTKRYAGDSQNALVSSGNGSISSVDAEALEEANGHIIKATCAAKNAQKNTVKIDGFRVFNFEKKDSYFCISFIVKGPQGTLTFSPSYVIVFSNISIFCDVPVHKPIWFIGEKNGDNYLKNVEFHVHSEDDMRFLLE